MKIFKKILFMILVGSVFLSCSEDEDFKDLKDQVFVYPIVENDGVVDRLTELAYDESPRTITMRIALHPRQSSSTNVTYEFRAIDDPEVSSATEGSDFEAISPKTVSIPANQDFVDVSFQILNDTEMEGAEEFIFYLTDASGLALLEGSRQYRFTIRESDQPVAVNLEEPNETTISEGQQITLNGNLATASDTDITVNVAVSGTATDGSDISLPTKSIDVAAGETSFTIPITIESDMELELDETFEISIESVVGNASIGDDDAFEYTIKDASLSADAGNLAFGLLWEDVDNINLDFHLKYDDGMDTLDVASSTSMTEFEQLMLDGDAQSGTYLVVVEYVAGDEEANYTVIVNNDQGELERLTGTISEGMDYVYNIAKENNFTLNPE